MTKEKLKKEAIKYAVDYPTNYGKGYKRKDLRIAYLASAEPRNKRIAELERENEKLKEQHRVNLIQMQATLNRKSIQNTKLIKAKEIIEDLIKFQPYINKEAMFISLGNEWKTAIYKAKQFLKEIE